MSFPTAVENSTAFLTIFRVIPLGYFALNPDESLDGIAGMKLKPLSAFRPA